MKRRFFLYLGTATLGTIALSRVMSLRSTAQPISSQPLAPNARFEVTKTEAEWRKLLTPEQFNILREHGTEPPYSSSLTEQVAPGTYHCAGCDLPLFSSETKFDSGTGWPSFYAPMMGSIATSVDTGLLMTRTEVHCRRCGGHLGHVFDDGPAPTGQRYCMNGDALRFIG